MKKSSIDNRACETVMNDQEVEKLIVVTQNQSSSTKSRGDIDKGLANIINDGLAQYQDELHQVRWKHLQLENNPFLQNVA